MRVVFPCEICFVEGRWFLFSNDLKGTTPEGDMRRLTTFKYSWYLGKTGAGLDGVAQWLDVPGYPKPGHDTPVPPKSTEEPAMTLSRLPTDRQYRYPVEFFLLEDVAGEAKGTHVCGELAFVDCGWYIFNDTIEGSEPEVSNLEDVTVFPYSWSVLREIDVNRFSIFSIGPSYVWHPKVTPSAMTEAKAKDLPHPVVSVKLVGPLAFLVRKPRKSLRF
jgi:hypothetical protein